MALTLEQRVQVYQLLDSEMEKARKSVEKARQAADNAPSEYGGVSVERESATVLLQLREAQYQAARAAVVSYFDAYITNAA